jgi:hypothetical protein
MLVGIQVDRKEKVRPEKKAKPEKKANHASDVLFCGSGVL